MTRHIPVNVARAVILGDIQALRFESCANELVSQLEGGRLVFSTSLTYDRGRDGKTIGPGPKLFVCSSLNDVPDAKALADTETIAQSKATVERLYFCSSQKLTEYASDRIRAALAAKFDGAVSIEVLGAHNLADIVTQYPEVGWKHYSAEIDDILRALEVGDSEDEEAKRLALELALCTVGHDDSSAIRRSAYLAALRHVLKDGAARNLAECSRDLSGRLKLGRSLPATTVKLYLDQLVAENHALLAAERYVITVQGQEAAEIAAGAAAEALMTGRRKVRAQIEEEIGFALEDKQFATMWQMMQNKLAHLFYTRGREMVDCVASLLEQEPKSPGSGDSEPFFANKLASAVGATASSAELGERIAVAIKDIFLEGEGAAFEWLVEVCAGFVTICSLGLEASSGERLRYVISKIALVYDTDVLLSLFGKGEPDHHAIVETTKRWRELGGQLLMAEPVAQEAAYHAWIADRDFHEVEGWLPGNELDRIRFIKNAFVRSFATILATSQRTKRNQWKQYIGQFRGHSEYDASLLLKHAVTDTKAGMLPRVVEHSTGWKSDVWNYCEARAEEDAMGGRDRRIKLDKARRDAELYISLVQYAETRQNTELEGKCFLVSSARRLSELESKFHPNESPRVLSISALVYMLSLVPGVSLGLSSLGSLLFDGSFHRRMTDLGMVLQRVLKDSEGFSLPWAGRLALERDVRTRIVARAIEAGGSGTEQRKREREIEREITSGEKPEAAATLLREALDHLGADTRMERQLHEAQRRIAVLEAELARRAKKK